MTDYIDGQQTNFEVMIQHNGRWVIDMVTNRRDEAIKEAKRLLFARETDAVKVVREDYDWDANEARTVVVFSDRSSAGGPSRGGLKGSGDVLLRRRG